MLLLYNGTFREVGSYSFCAETVDGLAFSRKAIHQPTDAEVPGMLFDRKSSKLGFLCTFQSAWPVWISRQTDLFTCTESSVDCGSRATV